MTERTNILKDGNEGIMKGYEGLDQPFIIKTSCISISYSGFMKSEGLTTKFVIVCSIMAHPANSSGNPWRSHQQKGM